MAKKVVWITGLSMQRTHYGVVVVDGEGWPYDANRMPVQGSESCIAFRLAEARDVVREAVLAGDDVEVMFSRPYTAEYRRMSAERFLRGNRMPAVEGRSHCWSLEHFRPRP